LEKLKLLRSQQNLIYKALERHSFSLDDFKIPLIKNVISTNEPIKIIFKKIKGYNFKFEYVLNQDQDDVIFGPPIFHVKYSPGFENVYDEWVVKKWEDIFAFPSGWINVWLHAIERESEEEDFYRKILKRLNKSIPNASLAIDEFFTVQEVNVTLKNALNNFSQKILNSKIPKQAQQKILKGVEEYYDKAKSGKYSKRDWYGSFLFFFYTSLGAWGIEKFADFIFDSIKQIFATYHFLNP
jgi:hypothetical protein